MPSTGRPFTTRKPTTTSTVEPYTSSSTTIEPTTLTTITTVRFTDPTTTSTTPEPSPPTSTTTLIATDASTSTTPKPSSPPTTTTTVKPSVPITSTTTKPSPPTTTTTPSDPTTSTTLRPTTPTTTTTSKPPSPTTSTTITTTSSTVPPTSKPSPASPTLSGEGVSESYEPPLFPGGSTHAEEEREEEEEAEPFEPPPFPDVFSDPDVRDRLREFYENGDFSHSELISRLNFDPDNYEYYYDGEYDYSDYQLYNELYNVATNFALLLDCRTSGPTLKWKNRTILKKHSSQSFSSQSNSESLIQSGFTYKILLQELGQCLLSNDFGRVHLVKQNAKKTAFATSHSHVVKAELVWT
ncbi:exocyst complex component 5-like [Penaeus monodon]|uniref:exocyst complex component 5-like n=1 Tax=Penaeus monodon TaxID=6687 RepID=UPI0018A7B469|nr:exocyst complex component 5-like [Penaeus monodon]